MDENNEKAERNEKENEKNDERKEEKDAEEDENTIKIALQYRPLDRLPVEERMTKCFICKDGDSVEEPLIQCEHKYKEPGIKCSTHFHQACIDKYNAGGFSMNRLESERIFKKCPLHICFTCWSDCMRTSALKGNLLQCHYCMRAFHLTCSPANRVEPEPNLITPSTVDADGKSIVIESVSYCICSRHQNLEPKLKKMIKINQKLSYCCECNEAPIDGETLQGCANCPRSFHPRCYRYTKVIPEVAGTWCERCIFADEFRLNEYVIVRYKNSWYPAQIVLPDRFPKTKKNIDKFGEYNAESGFVTVAWVGYTDTYAVAPYQHCIEMPKGSIDHFRHSDSKSRNGWLELEASSNEIPLPLPSKDVDFTATECKSRYSSIKRSIYYSDDARPTKEDTLDEALCDCPEGEENRCASGSSCLNRSQNQECPFACAKKRGGCLNREITNGDYCKYVKVKDVGRMGKGLFATKDLEVGTFIGEYAGEIISKAEQLRRIEQATSSRNLEEMHYMLSVSSLHRVVDAKFKSNLSRFINHSCEPNCIVEPILIVIKETKLACVRDERIRITTTRPIKADEQLTFDYAMEAYKESGTLQTCHCGSKKCRGTLGGRAAKPVIDDTKTMSRKIRGKRKVRIVEEEKENATLGSPRKRRTTGSSVRSQRRRGAVAGSDEANLVAVVPALDENKETVGAAKRRKTISDCKALTTSQRQRSADVEGKDETNLAVVLQAVDTRKDDETARTRRRGRQRRAKANETSAMIDDDDKENGKTGRKNKNGKGKNFVLPIEFLRVMGKRRSMPQQKPLEFRRVIEKRRSMPQQTPTSAIIPDQGALVVIDAQMTATSPLSLTQ
ncbi:unnamed protein product, partial [Mesorhabditis belari]|uniref:Histone-lysine N-methyltransferase n=1 Tax=Mesorhabditis belari TaxID=2138241 RepID=A0AAF3EST1_9BILA